MTADRVVRTTCPRDCYDACGALVLIQGDQVHAVRGDPEHHVSRGRLCRKCTIAYNGVLLDASARLTTPLRRVDAKGEGRFEAISWDEALAEIATRLGSVIDDHGAASILNAHYTGTCALIGNSFPMRFFNRLGATEVDPDSICNRAGYEALAYLYGDTDDGFDPETARDAACILVWGANPSTSAPHMHEHWLAEAPGTLVVVDPIRTPTAVAADIHLQPFPGSDAALAFALAHVLRRDGLVDAGYIDEHVTGYDELEPLLEPCTPVWGESATGVPAALIERAAHAYGVGPSLLWLGQGFQRQPRGGNALRAAAMLPALTGNLGRPGAGWTYVTGGGSRGIDGAELVASHLATDTPEPISHMDLADALADPGRARALVTWNINIAASNPRLADLRAAMQREDLFTVAIDLFATDTVDLADIVLPAASWLESDDLVCSYFHHTLSAQVKAVDPPGEALPNSEIFRRLATTLGFTEPELQESDATVIARLLAGGSHGVTWDALAAAGTVRLYAEPRIQPAFDVTIASAAAEADGQPRLPQPWHDDRPATGRLRVLSPASPWAMNTSFTNDPKVARKLGEPTVTLHPADAAARGLTAGQRVTLTNAAGSLRALLAVDTIAPEGVAYCPKGHWLKRHGGNANSLFGGAPSDMGRSTSIHGVEATVTAG